MPARNFQNARPWEPQALPVKTFRQARPKRPSEGPRATPEEKSPIHSLNLLTNPDIPTIVDPMPTALHIAGLPSQSPQGVGARLVRRVGGAVRSVIVRGITLAGTLRRPALSRTSRCRAAAQDPQTPAPSRVLVRRRPPAGLPAPLLSPPLLAHLLAARRHRRPEAASRPAFLQADKPFTPEAFPQLGAKACAVLNTPLKDCDPRTLELVVSTFASHINQLMSPEAGITDLEAAFPNLWHRLNAALADTSAETSPPPTPEPAAPADAVRDAPVASPHPPAPTGPTELSAKDPPRLSPLPLSDPRSDAATIAAAPPTTPAVTAPSAPVGHASPPLSDPGRSFRYDTQSFARSRRRHFRCPGHHGRPPHRHNPPCAGHLPQVSARQSRRKNVILYVCHTASTGPPSRGRAPNPAHVQGNERDHRTGVPPSALELIPEIKSVVVILQRMRPNPLAMSRPTNTARQIKGRARR